MQTQIETHFDNEQSIVTVPYLTKPTLNSPSFPLHVQQCLPAYNPSF
ncbi:hypothetical protein [Burkholderia sp. Ax-1724]|nr:hypothetical protein [Burkholderia sp. Ax-1724]